MLKDQLKFVRSLQKEHFTGLLKAGKDLRLRGIIWLIQQLKDI